jgi:dissimilatory sulfite reductase related protein
MGTATIAGHHVELDRDGYLASLDDWNEEIAAELAAENGVGPLTDKHWQVIHFCRRDTRAQGEPPGVRRISRETGIALRDMYLLFPKGPGKLAALISGTRKPDSCV